MIAWLMQITPSVPATAQPAKSLEAITIAQIVVLGAAMIGAFLAYMSKPHAEPRSWRAATYVTFAGSATYLAMYSGFVPETYFNATTNALSAGVTAVLLSGVAGALFVEMITKAMLGVQRITTGDKGAALAPPSPSYPESSDSDKETV